MADVELQNTVLFANQTQQQEFVGNGLYELLVLVAIPTVTMLVGSLTAFYASPSDTVQAMLSAFAGSLLLGSVAFELGPELIDPVKCRSSTWRYGIMCGFMVSYATIIFLDTVGAYLDPATTSDTSSTTADEGSPLLNEDMTAPSPIGAQGNLTGAVETAVMLNTHRRTSLPAYRRNSDSGLESAQGTVISRKKGRKRLSRFYLSKVVELLHNLDGMEDPENQKQSEQAFYPIGPVVLVTIDGISDGLTLGIAGSLGLTQGAILSGSLSIENAFTGAALSGILLAHGTKRSCSLATLLSVPVSMVIGALLGRLLILHLSADGPVYGGLIAFVVAQLFYLATVELIGEGHAVIQQSNNPTTGRIFDSVLLLGFVAECVLEAYLEK